METLICRMLMLSGVLVGVLLASDQGEQSLVPALLRWSAPPYCAR